MPRGTRRLKTETHAWCCKCDRMIEHDGFNKGQASCRECQRQRSRDRYSKGRVCSRCNKAPISNYCRGDHCRKCVWAIKSSLIAGRREMNPRGYVVLTGYRGHPNSDKLGRIYEHVLVMTQKTGRSLVPGENVHHINGVRDDNRPENLELWSTSQPSGQRVADKVEWAKELLSLYEPSALSVEPFEDDSEIRRR